MWIFGRVNGHLVAFEAVLEDHLGGDTELVLGGSALKQLNAARQKAAGYDEATIDLDSGWYKRIGKHPWLLKSICYCDGLIRPVVKVGTQQDTMISSAMYQILRAANQAGRLRLADQAAHASARVDSLAHGKRSRRRCIPYPRQPSCSSSTGWRMHWWCRFSQIPARTSCWDIMLGCKLSSLT